MDLGAGNEAPGHQRLASVGSRRSSISSVSDDGMRIGGRDRGVGTWSRASSQHHILSPPIPDHSRSVSASSFTKAPPPRNDYEYERGSISELPRSARKTKSIANMSLLTGFKRPKWLGWFRQKYWAYEVFGLIGSLLLFLTLIGLLKTFDGQEYQTWSSGITLNALVSLIVTLMGLSLIMPVQSCLGQLKWNRFRRQGGELREFDLHDQASRTAWGSAKLIVKKPLQAHGTLAAFIMIAIQTIAPFVQQIIHIGPDNYNFYNPAVPVARSYVESGNPALPIDQLTQFSVYQAVFSLSPGEWPFPVYPSVKNTDNATFDQYASLGLTSECKDISDKLTKKDITYNTATDQYFKVKGFSLALPNGHDFSDSLVSGADAANPNALKVGIFDISSSHDSIVFADKGNVLVDWTSIYLPPLKRDFVGDAKPTASECVIQFAGWPLTSNFTAGRATAFIETFQDGTGPVVDNSEAARKASPWLSYKAKTGSTSGAKPNQQRADAPSCVNVTVPTQPGQSENIGTCFTTKSRLAKFLGDTFNGRVSTTASPDQILRNDSKSGITSAQSDVIGSIASVVGGPPLTSAPGFDISWMMKAVAYGLANNIRTASPDSDRQMIKGQAHSSHIVYHIRWIWAGPPVLLMVMTTTLLIWTVIDTRRKNLPVWSTSCLADLVHGLDDTSRNTMMSIDEVEQLERTSERIKVFLRPSDKVLAAVDSGPLSGNSIEFTSRNSNVQTPSRPLFGSSHPYQQI